MTSRPPRDQPHRGAWSTRPHPRDQDASDPPPSTPDQGDQGYQAISERLGYRAASHREETLLGLRRQALQDCQDLRMDLRTLESRLVIARRRYWRIDRVFLLVREVATEAEMTRMSPEVLEDYLAEQPNLTEKQIAERLLRDAGVESGDSTPDG